MKVVIPDCFNAFWLIMPGILENPSNEDSWHYRGELWIQEYTNDHAIAMHFFDGVFLAGLLRSYRAWKASNIITQIRESGHQDIRVLTHSNGGAIACKLLEKIDQPIQELHMVASAADRDYNKNGLNAAVARGLVKNIYLYCSASDMVLEHEPFWFGNLGLLGPINMSPDAAVITHTQWFTGYDHSTYWKGVIFDKMFRIFTKTSPAQAEMVAG